MPAFAYQALDDDRQDATRRLAGRHRARRARDRCASADSIRCRSRKCAKAKRGTPGVFAQRGIGGAELALLTRQLATLIGAGLPIDEALGALSEQADNERQRGMTVALRARVMEGASLAQAMAEFPESFPEIFRATVGAGEQSGPPRHGAREARRLRRGARCA